MTTVWPICMVGTQPSTAEPLVAALRDCAASPASALAVLAEVAANRLDATLVGAGLRLIDDYGPRAHPRSVRSVTDALDSSGLGPARVAPMLGTLYEQLLATDARKSSGSHFTPVDVAGGLLDATIQGWDRSGPPEVLDPSCGGGAFLLVAASRLVDRWNLDRTQAVALLSGVDSDPVAVAVAEAALGLWCLEVGEPPKPLDRLQVGDALLTPLPAADLVVGNPPFLNQLEGRTARTSRQRAAVRDRFADLIGPYGDTAALFLLASAQVLRTDGRMTLIQPQSILASRDTGRIREWLADTLRLHGLWFCAEQVFSAAVRVCAPVFERAAVEPEQGDPGSLLRWTGPSVSPVSPDGRAVDVQSISAESWGPLVADLVGVPTVHLRSSVRVGAVANVTAGFRDQFYGFVDHTAETTDRPSRATPAAVTVGMIDPLHLRWGSGSFKYAGQSWERPAVDLSAVEAADGHLAQWAADRLQPKVLLATQTRVLEVVADPDGVHLPITPVISVEPVRSLAEAPQGPTGGGANHDAVTHDAENHDAVTCDAVDDEQIDLTWVTWWTSKTEVERVWLLTAALMAPPVTAWARAHRLGTAMSGDAVKLSAADVATIPLPIDRETWEQGAAHAMQGQSATSPGAWREALGAVGAAMTEAYGLASDEPVLTWWSGRLPDWR